VADAAANYLCYYQFAFNRMRLAFRMVTTYSGLQRKFADSRSDRPGRYWRRSGICAPVRSGGSRERELLRM